MIIGVTSVIVTDQSKAKAFYTDALGFQVKYDFPVDAAGNRWLTVVSPERPDGVELLLSDNSNPISQAFQQGMRDQNIAAINFNTSDIAAEHERLAAAGVVFTMPPTEIGAVIMAVFDDTCGNLINLVQEKG